MVVNNDSWLTFILSPLTFLIWAKGRYNFLNTGSGLEYLFIFVCFYVKLKVEVSYESRRKVKILDRVMI